jgi:hypothetical protein
MQNKKKKKNKGKKNYKMIIQKQKLVFILTLYIRSHRNISKEQKLNIHM